MQYSITGAWANNIPRLDRRLRAVCYWDVWQTCGDYIAEPKHQIEQTITLGIVRYRIVRSIATVIQQMSVHTSKNLPTQMVQGME